MGKVKALIQRVDELERRVQAVECVGREKCDFCGRHDFRSNLSFFYDYMGTHYHASSGHAECHAKWLASGTCPTCGAVRKSDAPKPTA